MKKLGLFVSIVVVAALATSGCNRIACERIAECSEDWGGDAWSDADIDECVDDLKEEDAACARASRAWARCLNREDCDIEACEEEAEEAMDACPND